MAEDSNPLGSGDHQQVLGNIAPFTCEINSLFLLFYWENISVFLIFFIAGN